MISNATKQLLRMLVDQLREEHGRYQPYLRSLHKTELAHLQSDFADLTTDASVYVVHDQPVPTTLTKFELPDWEYLDLKTSPTNEAPAVRRLKVQGGWLYQVAFQDNLGKWHPPMFVPDPAR